MSIYATLWSIQIRDPASPWTSPRWVEVTAQAVPPHIGSPTPGCGYETGDPYADFLPPPVETDESGQAPYDRAVVFVTDDSRKGTARNGQEYADPLLVLTGEEYAKMPFQVLLDRLQEAVRSGPRVVNSERNLLGAGQWRTHVVGQLPHARSVRTAKVEP